MERPEPAVPASRVPARDLEPTLERYAALVRAAPHDLLSPRALAELEARHLPECLALSRLLPPGPARLVDVGSGAGLPGLIIALARPDLEVTLVEATGKKARFLRATADALGAAVSVLPVRAETLAGSEFDLATARAVAPLSRLIPLVVPMLARGGLLYAVKGEHWRDELAAARAALRGARVVATPDDPAAVDAALDPPLRVVIIART